MSVLSKAFVGSINHMHDDELEKLNLTPSGNVPDVAAVGRPPKVYPRRNARLRIAMWATLIGGPLVIAMGAYEAYRGWQLSRFGLQVNGEVRSSEALNTGKDRTSYQLIVDYQPPEGKTKFRKTFVVSEDEFQRIKNGGQCTVRYLASDPTFSRVGDSGGDEAEMLAMGAGVLVFGVAVWWYQRRQLAAVDRYVRGESS